MTTVDDITRAIKAVVQADWNIRQGNVVPSTEDVTLKNGAVSLDAVYLYADMADSSGLARDFDRTTAAKVIRTFLDATSRVIRSRGGEIRSFDGDRVMAIFVGSSKNSSAAEAAIRINHAVRKIVWPAVSAQLPSLQNEGWELRHCVGVASGTALVVRGGVRGNNDLVSVGRAPNVAAKLSDKRYYPFVSWITDDVYQCINSAAKYSEGGRSMWKKRINVPVGDTKITAYRSGWMRRP